MYTKDVDASSALAFLLSQRTYIESAVYERRYPNVTYDEVLVVDQSAPDWAPTIAVRSMDYRGELEFIGPKSNDINRADVGYAIGTQPVNSMAIGYGYSFEELGQSQYMGMNLPQDKANAAMRITEQGLNKLAYLGNEDAGYSGLYNNPDVPVEDASGTIASLISAATDVAGSQALVSFFQGYLTQVYVDQTNTTFVPTHILLPPSIYQSLRTTILPFGGNMTVLSYLEANLGSGRQPVTIMPELSLATAGAGGGPRMMVYTRDQDTAKFHLPMPARFLQPYQDTALSWFVPLFLRTGGTEVRIPQAHLYIDGI